MVVYTRKPRQMCLRVDLFACVYRAKDGRSLNVRSFIRLMFVLLLFWVMLHPALPHKALLAAAG